MPIKFTPPYTITSEIAEDLLRIGVLKGQIIALPLTPSVLSSLRETARLSTTHYSTYIEGNDLHPDQVRQVVKQKGRVPGKEHDAKEVMGYYAALMQVERWVAEGSRVTEAVIQRLHALVMAGGKTKVKGTPYRDGQNVIRESGSGTIVYMPPEARDVPALMKGLVHWIHSATAPSLIVAALAHYQFATIHPYYDGNGRTARLLATLILHLGGYDLKGLYSLEEYYAKDLAAYYGRLSVGPSHNYYMGRAEADLTAWVAYFVKGMVVAFESVLRTMRKHQGQEDQAKDLRKLDPKQRQAFVAFKDQDVITAREVGTLFGLQPRTSAHLCKQWVDSGFLEIVDFSNKNRKYRLKSCR